jgi:hypothetical protein
MIRKIVLWLLPTVLLVTVSSVAAQQTKKVPRIGYLGTGSRLSATGEAFQQGLRDLGYIEGRQGSIARTEAGGTS